MQASTYTPCEAKLESDGAGAANTEADVVVCTSWATRLYPELACEVNAAEDSEMVTGDANETEGETICVVIEEKDVDTVEEE